MRLRHALLLSLVGLAVVVSPAAARMSLVAVPLSPDRHELATLSAGGFDVTEDVKSGRAVVVIPNDASRARLGALVPFRYVVEDYGAFLVRSRAADLRRAKLRAASGLPSGRQTYRVLQDYSDELSTLVSGHPGLVRSVVLPEKSYEGRTIRGVEIASGVNRNDDGRPVYVVMGLTHAREWSSGEVSMEFARDLAGEYGKDPRITSLLDRVRVIVVPVVNPDGFVASRGSDPGSGFGPSPEQRKNCKPAGPVDAGLPCGQRLGTDLNRNYGEGWGGNGAATDQRDETYRGPGPWSEPETKAVHEFSQDLQITGLQTIHNFGGLVLRPPGSSARGLAPDEPALKALGDKMAAAAGYQSQFGYQLYEVTGATEDWNYAAQNAFGYTIELGGTGFQGPYQDSVVDQYLGTPGTATAGKGVREALLLAAEQAGDPADHSVISGSAPAGATLHLHKDFVTQTSPVCITGAVADDVDCGPRAPVIGIPDFLDSRLTVPASGRYVWHIDPSTRPFVRATPEAWTLTCERGGAVIATQRLVIAIGQAKAVDPCGTASGPAVTPPGGTPPAKRQPSRIDVAVDRTSRKLALSRGIRVRVRCTARCTASARGTVSGKAAATGRVTLGAAGRRTFTVRISTAGRKLLATRRRASLRIVVRGVVGGRIHTTTRTLTL